MADRSWRGGPDEVLGAYDDAVRLADQWGRPAVAAQTAYLSADVLDTLERLDEARERAFECRGRAEDAGLEALAAAARASLGLVYHRLGRHHEAVEFLAAALPALQADPGYTAHVHERAVHLYGEAGAHFEILGLHRLQANRLAYAGRDEEALAELQRATASADALAPGDGVNPRRERAEVHYQAAWILFSRTGPQALERSTTAEREHTDVGAHIDASYDATLTSRILLRLLARPQDAQTAARRAMQLAEAGTDGEDAHAAAEEALADVLEALDPLDPRTSASPDFHGVPPTVSLRSDSSSCRECQRP